GRHDRRVTEQVANLGKRDAFLDESRGVLVSQVVPMQIDFPEALLTLGRQVLVAALAPLGTDAVRLEDGDLPGSLDRPHGRGGFVAEGGARVALPPASTVEPEPLQYGEQPGCSNRDDARPATLRRLATQHDDASLRIDVAEPERQHLTASHARVQRGDD